MRAYLLALSMILVTLCLFWSFFSTVFLTWPNLLNILTASSALGLLAIGAALVIGAGGIDLSVGSLMALSATVSAVAISNVNANTSLIVGICLITGTFAGSVNGFLIGKLKLPPFIATLGMLSLARGAALIISEGRPVYGLPERILFFGQGSILSIPCPVIIFLLAAIAAHLLLTQAKFGRHLLATGDNERAARNAGIKITRLKILLYAISG